MGILLALFLCLVIPCSASMKLNKSPTLRIHRIFEDNLHFQCEDQSKWAVTWGYRSRLKQWSQGDTIEIVIHSPLRHPYFTFHNLTKKEKVRGFWVDFAHFYHPKTMKIQAIEWKHRVRKIAYITLSNGFSFVCEDSAKVYHDRWEEGDSVQVFLTEKGSFYPNMVFNQRKSPPMYCKPVES